MDPLVAARKLVGDLVKAEQIEVRRAEIVGRDLAKHVETLGRPPSGRELEDWLGEHNQVTELYASTSLLEELIYRHLTPPPPAVAVSETEQRHPELERQVREALDAPEPYLVYADWLQEHGDPFGELIALGVAATKSGNEEDQVRFERFRKLHEARFLGDVKLAGLALNWRYGVVQSIEEGVNFETIPLATWEKLMRLRVCEFLDALTLRRSCTPDLDALLDEHMTRTVSSLTLDGAHWPERLVRRDHLRKLAVGRRLTLGANTLPPTLERLELGSGSELVVESSKALPIRELRVAMSDDMKDLHMLKLPELERLELSIDRSSADAVLRLVKKLELPKLAHLAITDGAFDAKAFGKLAKLPVAPQLVSLSLTNLELTDETIQAMAKTKRSFDALAELDVSLNELSRDGLEIAKELAPNVVSRRQNKRGNAMERRIRRWAGTRLTVAEEIIDPKAWKRSGVDAKNRWARYRGDDEYELYVADDLSKYGCSCPSSIQPCKHVVALALIAERTPLAKAPDDGIVERLDARAAERERIRLEQIARLSGNFTDDA